MALKIKWRVQPKETGRWASFHKRGWPEAIYKTENGDEAAAIIYCFDSYESCRVKENNHGPLTLCVADHSRWPWRWIKLERKFTTLQAAKEAFEETIKQFPHWVYGYEDPAIRAILGELKFRVMREEIKKCSLGHETRIQIYDFKNYNWVWYCKECQETLGDPNGI